MPIGQTTSQRFGYALHSVCYMAKKPPGSLSTLPELAEWLRTIWPNVSATYLSNVIQRLARGGLLRSHRGISGGYSLARPADQMSMRDLVELLDGVAQGGCSLTLEGACPVEGLCRLQRKLRRAEEQYLMALEELTVAEMANDLAVKFPDQATAKG